MSRDRNVFTGVRKSGGTFVQETLLCNVEEGSSFISAKPVVLHRLHRHTAKVQVGNFSDTCKYKRTSWDVDDSLVQTQSDDLPLSRLRSVGFGQILVVRSVYTPPSRI